MKRKIPQLLLAVVLFVVDLAVSAAPAKGREYGDKELAVITRMMAQILSKNHYRQQPLNTELSKQLFDEYLYELDPSKIYFTEEDVTNFSSDRELLCKQLQAGDSSFAFRVYDCFRIRNSEFRAFAEKRLKEPFDFTLDESFLLDRAQAPRAKNRAELETLWYLRLKNDVLSYRLLNRAQEEERAKQPKKDSVVEKENSAVAKWEIRNPAEKVLSRLRDISNEVQQKERIDILGIYLNSLAQVYGPHSNFLPPKKEEDFEMQMNLSLSGIGATLSIDDGYLKIVELTPGGPAARDGRLKVEDRIIAVAQENDEPVDVIDMSLDKAVRLIRGPAKTKVTLTILPGEKGRGALPETVTITRDKIVLVDSEAKGEIRAIKLSDGSERRVGVINLPGFYMDFDAAMKGESNFKSCTRDVRRILEDFKKRKVDAVVMDLRRNGGGSLVEAITLTGLFLSSGPVVQISSPDKPIQIKEDNDGKQTYAGPLVVLTSKLSASAAEIFTAAIRDSERGVVVGDSRTFGKGTVLDVVPLDRYLKLIGEDFPAGSATYEMAMFFRISGGSVQQLGIASDILLPSMTDQMEIGEMFMKNHLPWNSVRPIEVPRTPGFFAKIEALKAASMARIAADPEYSAFRKKLEMYNKYKDRKSVSLNESVRWKEYKEEKQLQDDAEKLYQERAAAGKPTSKDLVLDEAVRIAADFSALK